MHRDVLIRSAGLAADPAAMDALHRLYLDCLGFPAQRAERDRLALSVGGAHIVFSPSDHGGRPFYHFALLAPGNRYAAARRWIERCTGLLSRPGQSSTTFRFDAWDADACYFHDPAGNIVELIAHGGVGETGADDGPFEARELLGVSELGMVVTDPPAAADALAAAGLELWSGGVDGPDALAFVGGQAHTLILCPPGRPWLPTQRPAECHPLTATVSTASDAVLVSVAGGALTAATADG